MEKFAVTIEETALTTFELEAENLKEAEQKALSSDYELDMIQRHVVVCKKK